LQTLCAEIGKIQEHTGDVTARAGKASHEAASHRITFEVNRDHWNTRRRASCRLDSGRGGCHDGIYLIIDQVHREGRQARNVPIGKTDDYLKAQVALELRTIQALADCGNAHIHNRRFALMQQSDLATFCRLLRARCQRPCHCRTAEQ
jgi:hypothetical protein